jgi:ABC-type branched-subunit amino acid transport system substrate-binding protein
MRTLRSWRVLALLSALALVLAACGDTADDDATATTASSGSDGTTATTAAGGEGEPIHVGHITYHTGAFSEVGPFFDCATDFALGVINEDPPLGREMVQISQDIGEIGEAQGVRNLIENEGVEVLFGPAHEYESYRDFLLQYTGENSRPLQPSIHGGAVPREYGGTHEEPIFRGAPMDSDQAVAAVLQAQDLGAESVAIVATEIAGSQQQKDAAVAAAEELGLDVALVLDVQPELPSYRSEVARIGDANPDALLLFSQLEDGGTIVKQAAEAGLSLKIIGTTEWLQSQFPEVATMDAIEQHQSVEIVGFANTEGEAWDFYAPRWESSDCAQYADPQNSYAIQYYDILVVTALAIEKAGAIDTTAWADAMYDVSMEGTKVYTYQDGIDAIRNGEDIDYDGVTGDYNYTDTAVVSGLYGLFEWSSLDSLDRVATIEGQRILDVTG